MESNPSVVSVVMDADKRNHSAFVGNGFWGTNVKKIA
jgi:hypothetical protein